MHLGLYEGYVKNVNTALGVVAAYEKVDDEGGKYAAAEVRRRLAFEFNGMRMHELYFAELEAGGRKLEAGSALEDIEEKVREVASTRGIGWVVVYHDPVAKVLHTVFVNSHELGQLAGLPIILVLDMWEHAYMVDYLPADKKNYIDAFFTNLNWDVIEKRFDEATKMSAA